MTVYKKILFLMLSLIVVHFIFGDEKNDFHRVSSVPRKIDHPELLDWGYKMGYMDKIELIGWSRSSLLAYRYIDDGGGYGGFNYHFVIINTINDEIIERDSFNSQNVKTQREKDTYKVKWNLALKKFNIIGEVMDPCAPINNNDVMKFPLSNYECWFDYSYSVCDIDGARSDYSWKLIIGNSYVQKTVTSQITCHLFLIGVKIIGYYKSPFENRIAVFLSFSSYFSGNVGFTPTLYGCNMNIGLE